MTPAPPFVLVYGPSGVGKTTDSLLSFPAGLFAAAPGALDSAESVGGFRPNGSVHEVRTIEDAIQLIEIEAKKPPAKRARSLVVDDFSFLAQESESHWRKRLSGYKMWEKLRSLGLEFRTSARYAGMAVILNCWEQAPKRRDDGTAIRGGPMVPGRLPEQLPAMANMVLRAGTDNLRKPWSGVYRCRLQSDYVMKDRYDVATLGNGCVPMNLRELLRRVGFTYPRLWEWQEPVVTEIADKLGELDAQHDATVLNHYYGVLTSKGIDPRHARWTCRDGMDRAHLERAFHARNQHFI